MEMSPLFNYAVTGVLWRERGNVNDPDDRGGATSDGISLRFLRALEFDVDHDGDVDADDVFALSDSDKRNLYFNEFWIKGKCNLIKSDIIACKVLDMCVNMGIRQAWKIVQECINCCHDGLSTLAIDGIPGNKTVSAVNTRDDVALIGYIRIYQWQFYLELVEKNNKLQKYLHGWQRRATL